MKPFPFPLTLARALAEAATSAPAPLRAEELDDLVRSCGFELLDANIDTRPLAELALWCETGFRGALVFLFRMACPCGKAETLQVAIEDFEGVDMAPEAFEDAMIRDIILQLDAHVSRDRILGKLPPDWRAPGADQIRARFWGVV